MALDSINSSPGEAVRHLIGRGIEGEMTAPLDSFTVIQLNQHLFMKCPPGAQLWAGSWRALMWKLPLCALQELTI